MASSKTDDKLNASTMTIMAYSNIRVDYRRLFKKIPITDIAVSYTKKKRKPCLKKVKAPYGSIISLRFANHFRGIVTHPDVVEKEQLKNKYMQKEIFTEEERKRVIFYGEEKLKKDKKKDKKYNMTEAVITDDEKYSIGLEFICDDGYFLNQVTCILSIGDKLLNIMIFNSKFKIAGCKDILKAQEAMAILWSYIKDVKYSVVSVYGNSLLSGYDHPIGLKEAGKAFVPAPFKEDKISPPKFIFDIVMTNIDFFIGFPINRERLNNLMNEEKYRKWVKMSTYETTDSTNVNIKFFSPINDKRYKCLYIQDTIKQNLHDLIKKKKCENLQSMIMKGTQLVTVKNNPFHNKTQSKKEKVATLLVFQSSKTIGSACNYKMIKGVYEFFIDVVRKNRHIIEEKLIDDTRRLDMVIGQKAEESE